MVLDFSGNFDQEEGCRCLFSYSSSKTTTFRNAVFIRIRDTSLTFPVLTGEGIRNAAVVVTRYFGGVLLGTGGLVRAYTQAVKEGLHILSLSA